jgi:hypothetical protein
MHPTVLFRAVLVVSALAVGSRAVLADDGAPVAESCPESPEIRYFPVGTFGARGSDLLVREWYSKHLVAMGELSLSCGVLEDTETYRFLWLRTWQNPVAVRVFQRGDDFGLEAVVLDGAGGYDPGKVSRRVTRALSRDEWQMVIAEVQTIQFWHMATTGGNIGADGAQLIVEARRDGRYHIVDRWEGTDSALGSIGRLFSSSRT